MNQFILDNLYLNYSIIMDLPFDMKVIILSFLPTNTLHYYAIKSLVPEDLIYTSMLYKFKNYGPDKIRGIVNNFFEKCFKCSCSLGQNYNIILCYYCSEKLDDSSYTYPIICDACSDIKLLRGQSRFTFCNICKNATMHLGITPFS